MVFFRAFYFIVLRYLLLVAGIIIRGTACVIIKVLSVQQLLSTFSVLYPSITDYTFGRPATNGNRLYETRVSKRSRRKHSSVNLEPWCKKILPIYEYILLVKAWDEDIGENSELVYSLDATDRFTVNYRSGQVVSTASFQEEAGATFHLNAKVEDLGGRSGALAGTAHLVVSTLLVHF